MGNDPAAVCQETTLPSKKAYWKKVTHVLRGWQNRYFKLEKDSFNTYVLRYFADEAEAKKNSGEKFSKEGQGIDKLVKIKKLKHHGVQPSFRGRPQPAFES